MKIEMFMQYEHLASRESGMGREWTPAQLVGRNGSNSCCRVFRCLLFEWTSPLTDFTFVRMSLPTLESRIQEALSSSLAPLQLLADKAHLDDSWRSATSRPHLCLTPTAFDLLAYSDVMHGIAVL